MKTPSIGIITLAATLTSTPGISQEKTCSMNQNQIRERVAVLCSEPDFGRYLVTPKENVCEYSLDNGRTWKEHIPELTLGTTGGIAGLLILIGAGAIVFRYRKKRVENIDPKSALSEIAQQSAANKKPETITPKAPKKVARTTGNVIKKLSSRFFVKLR